MLHSCDVTILGAGVIGCAIARALSRFDCSFAVPERAEDVCCGIFKANKCHHPRAGSDAPAGSLKTRLNGRGNARMDQLAAAPDVPPSIGLHGRPFSGNVYHAALLINAAGVSGNILHNRICKETLRIVLQRGACG